MPIKSLLLGKYKARSLGITSSAKKKLKILVNKKFQTRAPQIISVPQSSKRPLPLFLLSYEEIKDLWKYLYATSKAESKIAGSLLYCQGRCIQITMIRGSAKHQKYPANMTRISLSIPVLYKTNSSPRCFLQGF